MKKTNPTPADDNIRKKNEEIFKLGKTYDELCYLNAEFDILTNKNKL